ncbi:extensin family protein [Lentibacter sp. XHP0401]|uniref:extensin-like domain-containing protein n=1 Tax=Lentibacter sp. XHP0401 TaxID=2984334 RepID=UPI0029823E7D|nr:extensin family protein [Lentibacter sp. XHP0401]
MTGGMICGDPSIIGEVVGDVPGKLKGCGINDAVKVRAVSGVVLSQGAVVECETAKALKTWLDTGVKPAFSGVGGGISKLRVAAHYSCRTRNHKKGAKISEHGKGRAIDISGFTTKDGNEYSVLSDYGKGKAGKAIRHSHKAACGPFGTTLGPKSDGYHEDHLHMDTARYRSGTYCR